MKKQRLFEDKRNVMYSFSVGWSYNWDAEKNTWGESVPFTKEEMEKFAIKRAKDEKRRRKMWTKIIEAIAEYNKDYNYPDKVKIVIESKKHHCEMHYHKPFDWENIQPSEMKQLPPIDIKE